MDTQDSILLANGYDNILLKLIQNLQNFEFIEGGEGFAYIINEQFIVKEYSKKVAGRNPILFDECFDKYCREMQQFADEGLSAPKVYSWLKVPNKDVSEVYVGNSMPYKYYILEENVPGRWIYYFYENFNEMYQTCKYLCSKQEFTDALTRPIGRMKLRKEILKAYISDYITMNKKLEAMSENEFEKFITSAYKMVVHGQHSVPDLFRKNVMVDDARITLIDNRFRDNMERMNCVDIDECFLLSVLELLEYNKYLEDNLLINSIDNSLYDVSIGKLIEENRAVCTALLQKILSILNEKMAIKPVYHSFVYEDIVNKVKQIIHDGASTVLPMVRTSFEME